MVLLWAGLLGLVLGLLLVAINWIREYFSYWKVRGVAHIRPVPLLGNILLMNGAPSQLYEKLYKKFPNEKVVGLYELTKKQLLIRDPELAEQIFVKEFSSFTDRDFNVLEGEDSVDMGLFALKGSKWKFIRNKLSPTFTSGRLKGMMDQMRACAFNLTAYMEEHCRTEIEARDLMFMFSTDVIATCAFGIDAKTMRNPNSEFRKMAIKTFHMTFTRFLKFMLLTIFPRVAEALRFPFTPRDVGRYFSKIIKETFEYRRKNNLSRNDFVQLLLQIKEKGHVEWTASEPLDDYLQLNKPQAPQDHSEMTDQLMVSQAFSFISAGSEPVANTMMFTAVEFSKNPQVQEKARKEVNAAMVKHGGLTYEALKDMPYLEQCINETLRMHPVALQLLRICTRRFTLNDGLTIDEGMSVVTSPPSMHYDPKYFPEPETFKPERFDPDQNVPKCVFIPFGTGPRICIAMRFAMVEMKVGLATILHRYEILPSPKTERISKNRYSLFSVPTHRVYLNIEKNHLENCRTCEFPPSSS